MLDLRRSIGVALVFLLILTAFIYWPGLHGPLILDDASNLEPLRELQRQGRLDFGSIMLDRGGWWDRPVSMLSFYCNWLISGDDIGSLKLTNLLIHLLCGVLVFFLSQCLLIRVEPVAKDHVPGLALCVSALWLLTPIHISTVLYIVQRMAQLATLFSLAGLLCFCKGRSDLEHAPVRGLLLILASLIICWPLATLSKENGALLPLLMIISEYFFYSQSRVDKTVATVRISLILAVFIPAFLVIAYALSHPQWIFEYYPLREFSALERLLTQPRVLLDYAGSVVQLPGAGSLGFFHDDVITSVSLLSPPSTLPALGIVISLPVVSVYWRRHAWSVMFYGVLFFLCAHLVEAGIFPLEMYFEHRNYLPAFGLMLSLTVGLYWLGQTLAMARGFKILLIVVFLSYAGLSAARAWVWRSWGGIVRVAVVKHPASVRAQAGVAITYLLAGEVDQALPYLRREQELARPHRDDAVNLKMLAGYCIAGAAVPRTVFERFDTGIPLRDSPATVSALRWFQEVISNHSCDNRLNSDRLMDILEHKSSSLDGPGKYSHNWELHYYLGNLLSGWNRRSLAYSHFKRAYQYAPDSRIEDIRKHMRSSQL